MTPQPSHPSCPASPTLTPALFDAIMFADRTLHSLQLPHSVAVMRGTTAILLLAFAGAVSAAAAGERGESTGAGDGRQWHWVRAQPQHGFLQLVQS
jgi:hypothetical protein